MLNWSWLFTTSAVSRKGARLAFASDVDRALIALVDAGPPPTPIEH
jgi:hypothetical protein